jgi:MFS family permease
MPPLSVGRQLVLNAYWVPLNIQNAALLTIAVPLLIRRFSGVNDIAELAMLTSLVAVISMIVPPIAGEISDRLHRAGGSRRNAILLGGFVNAAALIWMALSPEPKNFAYAVAIATLGQSVSAAAYAALIPEVVPRDQWGTASGYQGVGTLVGSVAGLAIAGVNNNHPIWNLYIAAAFMAAGSLSVLAVPEGKYVEAGHAHVSDLRNFSIAFAARCWTNFGLALLNTYILYFFSDVIRVHNASASTALAAGLTMAGAIVSSIIMGRWSDRVPRKFVVALAGVPMAVAVAGFGLVPEMRWIPVFAIFFGFGYGAIVSTGWALAIDSVPQIGNVARYLGFWGAAFNLPAILAPQAGKWILNAAATPLAGYRTLFIAAAICFVLGSLVVLWIRRADFA